MADFFFTIFCPRWRYFLLVQRKSFIEATGIEKMYQLFNAFIQLMLVPALFYILGKYF